VHYCRNWRWGHLGTGSDAKETVDGQSLNALEKELKKCNEVLAGLKGLVDSQRRCIVML